MFWLWLVLGVVGGLVLLAVVLALAFHLWCMHHYLPAVLRIFVEKPLFIVPRGQPVADAEDVTFQNDAGLNLRGCYLRTTAPRRRGVVLFGLEFGSNRWACVPYCQFLRDAGFDVFSFEPRGQGDSDAQPGYEPLQWVTTYEYDDFRAALAYLKSRADADPRGLGLFAISKGAGAGLLAAAWDPSVRCCVTDGMFATHTTMVPYMRKWIEIYSRYKWAIKYIPGWYYHLVARIALPRLERLRNCRFPHLERRLFRLAPRPLLMIHGGGDTYIKPDMARALFERAGAPKEFWLVDGAKHNQAFQVANGDYQRRVLAFFEQHLADPAVPAPAPAQPAPELATARP